MTNLASTNSGQNTSGNDSNLQTISSAASSSSNNLLRSSSISTNRSYFAELERYEFDRYSEDKRPTSHELRDK